MRMSEKIAALFAGIALCFAMQANAFRDREPLEAFDLKDLYLFRGASGTTDCVRYALVKSPDGYMHRLYIGQYAGKDNGFVTRIDAKEVELREVYWDVSKSDWQTREVLMRVGAQGTVQKAAEGTKK